jgi:hypothetical protein
MKILESKLAVQQAAVAKKEQEEEEKIVPAPVVVVVHREKSEEDYRKEMAAKIQEIGDLIAQVDIQSPLAPRCQSCSNNMNAAEFYCTEVDEGKCSTGAAGKRYFCSECSPKYHNDHSPNTIAELVYEILKDWISLCYAVKITFLRAHNEFKSKLKLVEYLDKVARDNNIDIPSLLLEMNMIYELSVKV